MGKKHFCFFQIAETGNRTPNSGGKGSGANHYPRAPAQYLTKQIVTQIHKLFFFRLIFEHNLFDFRDIAITFPVQLDTIFIFMLELLFLNFQLKNHLISIIYANIAYY